MKMFPEDVMIKGRLSEEALFLPMFLDINQSTEYLNRQNGKGRASLTRTPILSCL
jgi:hypothetical protein